MRFSVPPGYRRTVPIRRPKLDGFSEIIEQWLVEDVGRPRKQRHTAKRVFDRLRDEHGFSGGYTIVKDYVREQQRRGREMFMPLHHAAGHAQADFGEALAVIGGVEQKAYFFAFDLPHSDASYIRAYAAATSEAWVDGHVHAFAFFGRVPLSVLYDNDRCLVARIQPDGTRRRTRLFSGFLSHYVIQDRYGRPGKGNDKGSVEGLVGLARRNFMVPLPQFASWDDFNVGLEAQCRTRQADILRGHSETIEQRLQRDLAAMAALPATPFDACDQASARVSSQALVRYKTNDYSVPVAYGHRDVWVRGYVDQIVIGCGADIIARHPRCYGSEELVFDPVHYLPLLEQKVGALDQAAPLVGWDLPAAFQTLRRLMEARMLKAEPDVSGDNDVLALGPYLLDRRQRRLTRDGDPVALGSRAFDTLAVLAAASGQTLTKDHLLERVWPGLTVEENNLQVQVSALRKVLGEGWIVTVPGRGYRLIAPRTAAPPTPALPDKPSLVVLPFQNLSGDPEQDYFVDGLVEDITTALSCIRSLFVIARNSAFTYKGHSVDVRQVGRELGVRYVLEGSVRKAGGRVRITGQLVNAATGAHLWADRFDGALDDVFDLQDRVAGSSGV